MDGVLTGPCRCLTSTSPRPLQAPQPRTEVSWLSSAAEAEDDFHTLFGKAFLEAYEEQMARLKDAGAPAPR